MRVVLVHWHEAEAHERAERLRAAGFFVDAHWRQGDGKALTRALMAEPPAAVVVDLARLPSHGREVARYVRERKALQAVVLVFVPGDEAKTARARAEFPDAVFAGWDEMPRALPRAIAAVPSAAMAGRGASAGPARACSTTPLLQKLGLAADHRFAIRRAPDGFLQSLAPLPAGVATSEQLRGAPDVVLLFCRDRAQLAKDFATAVARLADDGKLWVAWPKKASGVATDLTEDTIRALGLEHGVVDTKVCAIDAVWSGLRFSRRRAAR